MKSRSEIKRLAYQIAEMEKKSCNDEDAFDTVMYLEHLTDKLSFEDMMAIDEYIMKHELLTK